jgi:hypothetical protein
VSSPASDATSFLADTYHTFTYISRLKDNILGIGWRHRSYSLTSREYKSDDGDEKEKDNNDEVEDEDDEEEDDDDEEKEDSAIIGGRG